MQFYQKRSFGKLVSDTFIFFKENGGNYFKNFILLNGLLLILLVIAFIFGYRELFSQLFGSNLGGESFHFEAYFQENQGMLIALSILIFILFLALLIISYSFPVFYMKRRSETGSNKIKADDILSDVKNNIGRLLKLWLGIIFIIFPAVLIIYSLTSLLIFIVIGMLLLLLITPAIMNMINFLMYDYLHADKNFFQALGYAIKSQFSYSGGHGKTPFWKYWGSACVIYIIIQTATSIFTTIPMLIYMMTTFIIPEAQGTFDESSVESSMGAVFFLIYGVSMLVSFLMMNVLYINTGFLYYDSRIDLHREVDLTEIESIGTNEE